MQLPQDLKLYIPDGEQPSLRYAADDLIKDLRKQKIAAALSGTEKDCALLAGSICNPQFQRLLAAYNVAYTDIQDLFEGHKVAVQDGRCWLIGTDERGAMWAIYEFCRSTLGVDPMYRWTEQPVSVRDVIDVQPYVSPAFPFKFRGWFINDEDLLTGFKKTSDPRDTSYTYYHTVVNPSVMEMVLETALRLKQNLMIPASLMNVDNPHEERLVRQAADRGLYVSQHHIEPLGVSHFTWDYYFKKYHGTVPEPSYVLNKGCFLEIWRYYAQKWAQYPNVIWQLGLRGRGDRPAWNDDPHYPKDTPSRGAVISDAMEQQYNIVADVLGTEDFLSSSTLWMEASKLQEEGTLRYPAGTMRIFADTGYNQMMQQDFYDFPGAQGGYGVYYHVAYFGDGPHMVQGTSPEKIYRNYSRIIEKGCTDYSILNVSNIREFVMNIQLVADLTNGCPVSRPDAFLQEWCGRQYGDAAAAAFYEAFYSGYASVDEDTQLLDGMTIQLFRRVKRLAEEGVNPAGFVYNTRLRHFDTIQGYYDFYHPLLKESIQTWEDLYERACLYRASKNHKLFEVNLLMQLEMILGLYRWLFYTMRYFLRRERLDLQRAADAISAVQQAKMRAVYGIWYDWYAECVKFPIEQLIAQTKGLK